MVAADFPCNLKQIPHSFTLIEAALIPSQIKQDLLNDNEGFHRR